VIVTGLLAEPLLLLPLAPLDDEDDDEEEHAAAVSATSSTTPAVVVHLRVATRFTLTTLSSVSRTRTAWFGKAYNVSRDLQKI
jgi:hypothetical protein